MVRVEEGMYSNYLFIKIYILKYFIITVFSLSGISTIKANGILIMAIMVVTITRAITPTAVSIMGGRRPFRGGPAEDGAAVAETEVAQVKRGPKFNNRIENFAYTWEKLLDLSDWHRFILFHGYQVDFQDTPPRRRCLNLDSAQGCAEKEQFQV